MSLKVGFQIQKNLKNLKIKNLLSVYFVTLKKLKNL